MMENDWEARDAQIPCSTHSTHATIEPSPSTEYVGCRQVTPVDRFLQFYRPATRASGDVEIPGDLPCTDLAFGGVVFEIQHFSTVGTVRAEPQSFETAGMPAVADGILAFANMGT